MFFPKKINNQFWGLTVFLEKVTTAFATAKATTSTSTSTSTTKVTTTTTTTALFVFGSFLFGKLFCECPFQFLPARSGQDGATWSARSDPKRGFVLFDWDASVSRGFCLSARLCHFGEKPFSLCLCLGCCFQCFQHSL